MDERCAICGYMLDNQPPAPSGDLAERIWVAAFDVWTATPSDALGTAGILAVAAIRRVLAEDPGRRALVEAAEAFTNNEAPGVMCEKCFVKTALHRIKLRAALADFKREGRG